MSVRPMPYQVPTSARTCTHGYDLTVRRPVPRALWALDRFNARHPWSHNGAYNRFVLRQARRTSRGRAVDVGCGTGNLLRLLAPFYKQVVGIELDSATAACARTRTRKHYSVSIQQTDFMSWAGIGFDLVTVVAALHHLPLEDALRRLRRCTAPGDRLVIVGVHQTVRDDLLRSLLSLVLNPIVGLLIHPRSAAELPGNMQAPIATPQHTFAQIAAIARRELPGVRMRRRLFWRYTAVWVAPTLIEGRRRP